MAYKKIAKTLGPLMADEETGALLVKQGDDPESILYDGGGALKALQLEADSAEVVDGGAAVIAVGGHDVIDITMVNAAATESCTLLISQFSEATPTVANERRPCPLAILAVDSGGEVDLQMVGLDPAVGYAKGPVRATVTRGSYLMISLIAESAGGAKYLRYELH